MAFLIFKIGSTNHIAQLVSILRAKFCEVIMKCKNVMLLLRLRLFFSPSSYPVNSFFFQLYFVSTRFMLLMKHFFRLNNHRYDSWNRGFPPVSMATIFREINPFIIRQLFSSNGVKLGFLLHLSCTWLDLICLTCLIFLKFLWYSYWTFLLRNSLKELYFIV